MTDDTWKQYISDRKQMKLKVIRVESAAEAALKKAEELYKKADEKVKSSATVDKRKYIDALATEAQNAASWSHKAQAIVRPVGLS